MPPLPTSNTNRLYLDYTVGGEDHTQIVRYLSPTGQGAAISTLVELWAFLNGTLYQCDITGLRFSVVGSNVTNPLVWPGNATYGVGNPTAGQEMKFFSIVGKSQDGRRVRMEQFGSQVVIPPTWRQAMGVSPSMDSWFDHVQSAHDSGTFCTISGAEGLFNLYYNWKYSDNDINKVRG